MLESACADTMRSGRWGSSWSYVWRPRAEARVRVMAAQDLVAAFFEAAAMASGVLASKAVAEQWAQPSALEGFSVGGLAGHMYATARRLEVVLDEEPPQVSPSRVVGLAAAYGLNRIDDDAPRSSGMHPMLVEDGERRAKHGPTATCERFRQLISRLEQRLPAEPQDRLVSLVTVPDGAMLLGEYLRTRVVELVVHSDDLAASVRLPPVVLPDGAASVVIQVLVELARGRSNDLDIIRTFTRAERSNPDVLRVF